MTARRYIISGQVQGVGYRFFVVREAAALAISGFVRNLADGSVEVVAEGATEDLGDFERRLSQGPPASVVESMISSATPLRGTKGFTIR